MDSSGISFSVVLVSFLVFFTVKWIRLAAVFGKSKVLYGVRGFFSGIITVILVLIFIRFVLPEALFNRLPNLPFDLRLIQIPVLIGIITLIQLGLLRNRTRILEREFPDKELEQIGTLQE